MEILEWRNTKMEIKILLDGLSSRVDMIDERVRI